MHRAKHQRKRRAEPPRALSARAAAAPVPPVPPGPPPVAGLGDLVKDPHNRRLHPTRNVTMLAEALRTVGAGRSIVIDDRNEVIAGNGVLEAAPQAGISKVRVIDTDGTEIIAVRRTGLTAAQKRDMAMYDNRTAELAEWNIPQLEADFKNGDTFAPFFTHEELQKMRVVARTLGAANQVAPGNYLVVITCRDEQDQVALLGRLMAEGLICKALVS